METALIGVVLRSPRAVAAYIGSGTRLQWLNRRLIAFGLLGAVAWGGAVGSYAGWPHVMFALLKMPLFFALTLLLCFALMHIVLVLSGLVSRATETLSIALSTLCVTTCTLGAIAPMLTVFCLGAPEPDYTAYLSLYLVCALCGVVAGVAGVRHLVLMLRELAGAGVSIWRPLILCVFIYQFVGAQAAYVLRPWIGDSAGIEGYYSFAHGLDGNFYAAVWKVAGRFLHEIGIMQ